MSRLAYDLNCYITPVVHVERPMKQEDFAIIQDRRAVQKSIEVAASATTL